MDAFVFPSHTDTFGNVVLEALASGVPAIVTPDGGPAWIVRDAETGFIRADDDFAQAIVSAGERPGRACRYASARSPLCALRLVGCCLRKRLRRYDTVRSLPVSELRRSM